MNIFLYNQIKNYVPYNEREKDEKEVMLDFIKNNKDVLTRDNKIAHFTTSAWIVNKDKTKVLMIYHNIYNSWAWVGGHADGEENLFKVIKREIEEETGLTNVKSLSNEIYGINIGAVNPHYKNGKYVGTHLHLDVEYLFEANEEDETRIKEDENSGVKWIEIDKINDYVLEEKMQKIYLSLNERLKNY